MGVSSKSELAKRLPRARVERQPARRIAGLDKGAKSKEQRTKHKTLVHKQPLVSTYFSSHSTKRDTGVAQGN